ncbi:MAG: hypothetical protein ABW252_25700 [Polyangiales bacterium]
MFACWRVERVLLVVGLLAACASGARAEVMALALERLSAGDCAGTLTAPAVLRSGEGPALTPDREAWRALVSELSGALAAHPLGPVIGSGPRGFELALETNVTDIDAGARAWRRGTRGRGVRTCAGENDAVRPVLVSNRLRVDKGLPLGATLGASVGRLRATGSYLVGAALKLALLEDALGGNLPDLALRGALTSLVGEPSLTLFVITADALISDRFVVAQQIVLAPFAGAGAVWTRARTEAVDLTPNIDAEACALGSDPRCAGASDDDLAHDVQFASLSLLRYRVFGGVSARYRFAALALSASADLLPPGLGELGRGPTTRRQWTLSVAPSLTF